MTASGGRKPGFNSTNLAGIRVYTYDIYEGSECSRREIHGQSERESYYAGEDSEDGAGRDGIISGPIAYCDYNYNYNSTLRVHESESESRNEINIEQESRAYLVRPRRSQSQSQSQSTIKL